MWYFCCAQIFTLLLITSQTDGEVCSVKDYGENYVSYIVCPPGEVMRSNVWFKFNKEGDRLEITCNKNSSAEQLQRYLTSIPRLKKEPVNLTYLKLKGCPAPGGSESFSSWLSMLGSQVGSLRHLNFRSTSSGDEAILKSENFVGLENLTTIELWGSLETLGPKLLSNLTSLEDFKCSRNHKGAMLTSVHELAFNQNKNLRKIRISNSMVSTIHEDTFKGLKSLESLDIGHNKITSIPEKLLSDLQGLKELILRHNSIVELPQNLLLNNPNLETFSVQYQTIRGGEILKIPANLFQNSANLVYLRLRGNFLNTLPNRLFKGLQKLKILELNENNLTNSAITGDKLKDLDSLEEINLTRNQFTSPLTDLLHSVKDTLKKVDLKHNHLSTFESGWATDFMNLEEINLQNNSLRGTLHQPDFHFKSASVVKVDLQDNQINRLILDQKSDPCVKPTAKLNLKNNQIACDCFAYELRPIMSSKKSRPEKSCIFVEGLENQECPNDEEQATKLKDASPDSLTCRIECGEVLPNKLFQRCHCLYMPSKNSAVVDCSPGGLSLTGGKAEIVAEKIEEIKVVLRDNDLTELHSSMWKVANNTSAKIKYLDVSNNNIDKILQEHLPDDLSELFLDNNRITGFNENTLKHLNNSFESHSIHLGDNPYSCKCSKSKVFIEFLNSGLKAKINDTNDINFTCSPSLPLNSKDRDIMSELCHATASVYGSSLLFAIVGVGLLGLVLKKKEYLQLRFYSLPWVFDRFPEDWNLKYDAFISYSDHDKDFVEGTLWPQLEKNKSYSCCVHVRDFVVGDPISDQILRAVGQSRRTIIVLSPEYAAATWTKLEFQAAHTKASGNPRQRLIIVIPPEKDLPDQDDVDEDLQAYYATALKADDPKFWTKLKLALPQKEEERVLRDQIEEEDKKETQGIRLTERIDEVTDIIRQIS